MPLEGLLVFLGKDKLQKGGVVKRPPDLQPSYALPVTQRDFGEFLQRLQNQSNMIIRPEPTKWTVQKLADEGSRSPFMARLFIGLMKLRDAALADPAKREAFDKAYEFTIMSLWNTRTTANEITRLLEEHVKKVESGQIARVMGNAIHVDEEIDRELRKQIETFLNSAVRTLKQGMQDIAKSLQSDIGFLFKKAGAFTNGLLALEKVDPELAAYLRETRTWSEPLVVGARNAMEHTGWMLPKIKYTEAGGAFASSNRKFLAS